jgi:O-antigen/teichoic acid export membrane protein
MGLASKSLSIFVRDSFLFVSNAVVSIILARSLGPFYLGIWFTLNLLPSYAELFGRIKIDAAAVFFLSKGKYLLEHALPTINLIALFFSFLLIGVYLFFFSELNNFFFKSPPDNIGLLVVLILVQIPLNFLYMNYLYIHIYLEDKSVVNQMAVLRSILSFGIIIAIFFINGMHLDIQSVIIAMLVGVLSALVWGIYKSPKHNFVEFNLNILMVKDLLKYGGQLYVGGIFAYLNIYLVQFFVLRFLTPIQMGYYTVAQQNSLLFQKFTDAISVFFFPLISKTNQNADIVDITLKAFRTILLLLMPCLLLAFLFLKPVIMFTYGKDYLESLIPILIILPGITLSTSTSPISIAFQASGKPHLTYIALLVPVLTQLVLLFILVPMYGINGAAACFSIGCVLTAAIQLLIFKNNFVPSNFLRKIIIQKADYIYIKNFFVNKVLKKT